MALNIDRFVSILKAEYEHWEAPIITELSSKKSTTPFQILVSTLLSLRTKDEVTGPAAGRLFAEIGRASCRERV